MQMDKYALVSAGIINFSILLAFPYSVTAGISDRTVFDRFKRANVFRRKTFPPREREIANAKTFRPHFRLKFCPKEN